MSRLRIASVFTLAAVLVVVADASASGPSLLAGAARANITPDPQVKNWVTDEPYGSVLDSIYVRALVLSDGETEVTILAWDLISASEVGVGRVRAAISDSTGIPASHILINSSHSHSAPFVPDLVEDGDAPWDSTHQVWAQTLPERCAVAAKKAQAALEPASLAIGRAYAGEWLFNRRPLSPADTVVTVFRPENPYALPNGLRFRDVDPTATVISVTDADSNAIATVFSVACHAVSTYKESKAISGGWPGAASRNIEARLGGEVLFLQGCAGDVVPSRRGLDATEAMGEFYGERVQAAHERRHPLPAAKLSVARDSLAMPVAPEHREGWDTTSKKTEVQVISYGGLAIVGLPGEPLVGIAKAIQDRSDLPHTVVLGYTNGGALGYVGMPGELGRGGYESTMAWGTEESGLFLVETAVRLLSEVQDAQWGTPE